MACPATCNADKGLYYAMSDNRSQSNPARFCTLAIDTRSGPLDDSDIEFTGVATLLAKNGVPFPRPLLSRLRLYALASWRAPKTEN